MMNLLFQTEIVSTAISSQGVNAVERYVNLSNSTNNGFATVAAVMMFLFVVLPIIWVMMAIIMRRGFKSQQDYLSNAIDPSGLQMAILNEMLGMIRRSEAKFDTVIYGINRSISFEQLVMVFEEKLQRNKLELFVMLKNIRDNDNVNKDEEKIRIRIKEHIARLQSDAVYFINKFSCDEITIDPAKVMKNDLAEDQLNKMSHEYIFNPKERDTFIFDTIACINDDILKTLEKYKRKQD